MTSIQCITLSGCRFTIHDDFDNLTVGDLRSIIIRRLSKTQRIRSIKIIYLGLVLDDDSKSISDYNLMNNTSIHIIEDFAIPANMFHKLKNINKLIEFNCESHGLTGYIPTEIGELMFFELNEFKSKYLYFFQY